MGRLTNSQRNYQLTAQEALERRELVLLKGQNDGKTRVLYEIQESVAERGDDGIVRAQRRHPENSQIEFVNCIAWPRADKVTETSVMRQLLQYWMDVKDVRSVIGEKIPVNGMAVEQTFRNVLRHYREQDRILCIAVDNAELLPSRAFTVLKALNELRDTKTRKDIGVAGLISGKLSKLIAHKEFFKHATEVPVGRITAAEIGELIENTYPGESIRFDEKVLRELAVIAKEGTTLDVHRAARKSIIMRRDERKTKIDSTLFQKALAA